MIELHSKENTFKMTPKLIGSSTLRYRFSLYVLLVMARFDLVVKFAKKNCGMMFFHHIKVRGRCLV